MLEKSIGKAREVSGKSCSGTLLLTHEVSVCHGVI